MHSIIISFINCDNQLQEANDIAVSCMKFDSASADAIYVRGLCLYYKDNLDKGLTHFQQVLALDPDHNKARVMRLKAKSLKEKKENGKWPDLPHLFLYVIRPRSTL